MDRIDLNSDLGESFGAYTVGLDREVIDYVSSVNVACGYHAGDPMVMDQTVATAKQAGVAVGAHPGFPDLMGFGRRNLACSPKEIKAYVQYQLGALLAFTAAKGVKLQHCKPHGALYNMAAKEMDLARAIAEAVAEVDKDIILMGLAGSKMLEAGKQVGLRVASEVFAHLKSIGGVKAIQKINEEKAKMLYDFIDQSSFYKNPVEKQYRSLMNVPFTTPTQELDASFVAEASKQGLISLKGHRLVGGMRASIYNAMPVEGVKKLIEFMGKFELENK